MDRLITPGRTASAKRSAGTSIVRGRDWLACPAYGTRSAARAHKARGRAARFDGECTSSPRNSRALRTMRRMRDGGGGVAASLTRVAHTMLPLDVVSIVAWPPQP